MKENKKPNSNSKNNKKKTSSSKKQTNVSTTKAKSSNKTNIFASSLYKKLVDETSIIFLYKPTIDLLKTNDKLQSSIEFFINAIYTYELNSKTKDKKANDFLAAYQSITNNDFKLEKLPKNKIDEVDDELSFLYVFIKNTLNQDWNKIVESFKSKKIDDSKIDTNKEKIILGGEQVVSSNNSNQDTNSSFNSNNEQLNDFANNYKNNFNVEDFMKKNNISMDQIADSAINQQATVMLQKDIMENRFYKYKTKPTFFVIIKWILFSIWIITAISLIIESFSFVGLNNNNYLFLFNNIDLNQIYSQTNNNWANFVSIVGKDNLFIVSTGANIFGYIVSVLFPLLIVWYAYIQIKNYKNENAKFTCKTFITWLLLIWIFFVLFGQNINDLHKTFDLNGIIKAMNNQDIKAMSYSFSSGTQQINIVVDNSKVGVALLLSAISSIIYFIAIGLSVILSIAIIITRPKLDVERMQAKIIQYSDDIKSGKIPFDNNMIGGTRNGFNPFNPF